MTSFLFIIILLQTFAFNISAFYLFDTQKNIDDFSNEWSYMETNKLPFIFLKQQNSSESIKLDSGSSFIIFFGTFAKNVVVPALDFNKQIRYFSIKQHVPLFIKGRSLRN